MYTVAQSYQTNVSASASVRERGTSMHLRPLPLLALDYCGGGVRWLRLHAREQVDSQRGEGVGVGGQRLVLQQFKYLQTHSPCAVDEKIR